jgi:hypothetical protein
MKCGLASSPEHLPNSFRQRHVIKMGLVFRRRLTAVVDLIKVLEILSHARFHCPQESCGVIILQTYGPHSWNPTRVARTHRLSRKR